MRMKFYPRAFLVALGLAISAALALASATGAAAQGAPGQPFPFGVWENPKKSVQVEIRPCGANACGYVVWASAKAQADARKGGTAKLVGLQLLRDFSPQGGDLWRGKVFVPDMNAVFSGTAKPTSDGRLLATGCLLGRVLCKTQVWTRA